MTDAAAPAPTSPLTEADPLSLDELFNRVNDKLIAGLPEAISVDDTAPLVKILREKRVTFLSEQDKIGKAPPVARKKKPTSIADAARDFSGDL